MKIDVMEITKERYTNNVYTLAYLMNEPAVNEIASEFQKAWDDGAGFTISTIFGRTDDSEEELSACVKQIQLKLEQIVKLAWVSQHSRGEIVSLITLLAKGPQGRYTRVKLDNNLELTLDDIALEWNNAHPEMDDVIVPVVDYII